MKNNYWFLLVGILFFAACKKDSVGLIPELKENLADYVGENPSFQLVQDSLIACAVGGQEQFLTDAQRPISILFYPEGNATEFQYFETENINVNPDDLAQYKRVELSDEPIINGYLHRFLRTDLNENTWCRVSFIKNGNLHISNPIRIKYNDLPSEYNADLLTIDQSNPLSPIFSWEDGRIEENQIYFQMILDKDGDLLSGTYTFDRQFQFYDLSNVVLNISPTDPIPTLMADENYTFLMLGVSIDSWVNLIVEKDFDTK